MLKLRTVGLMLGVWLAASAVSAQEWQGDGRLTGRVVDEQKQALEGVRVVASFSTTVGVLETETDRRGDWSIENVADGTWVLGFEKDGYVTAEAHSEVDEGRAPSVRITLKKAFDPNAFIQAEIKKADALLAQKKYTEARAIFEAIIAKVPEVSGAMQANLSRTYYYEGKLDKAIEHLRAGVAADPNNVPTKMLFVSVLAEAGKLDEAVQTLGTINEAAITDPQVYLSLGLSLINRQRPADALPHLEKAVTRFPRVPQPYYYRAHANIALFNAEKDPKSPARAELLAKIKADLNKFLELAPNTPEAAQVKQLLEQISK